MTRTSIGNLHFKASAPRQIPHLSDIKDKFRTAHREPRDQGPDQLEPFGAAIVAVRWTTTMVSLVLVGAGLFTVPPIAIWLAAAATLNTIYRTFRPIQYPGTTKNLMLLLAETAFLTIAVTATGAWQSPLVLLLTNTTIIAGFARGYGFAIRLALTTALAVSLPAAFNDQWTSESLTNSSNWTTLLLLSGAVAGYGRRLSGEANKLHNQTLHRVKRLSDANMLLARLHRVAQTLPASLDEADVVSSSVARLKSLMNHHHSFVILSDESNPEVWKVAYNDGIRVADRLTLDELPGSAKRCIEESRLVASLLVSETSRGFAPSSKSGIYTPLLARGRLIGLLAVESDTLGAFDERSNRLLSGFVEPVALAIDNARIFGQLRTIGANEERTRIARDLHDRIGQSMAFLGFEIERLLRVDGTPDKLTDGLKHLREDLREIVTEVRETLYDLRTDVDESTGLAETLHEFASRLAERSGITVFLDCEIDHRLPILQEREIWRIAHEALTNAERHAKATEVSVVWRYQDNEAVLEISDNGQGLPEPSPDGRIGRTDSYGITGMRERAASIGAVFEMISNQGEGTQVKCNLTQT